MSQHSSFSGHGNCPDHEQRSWPGCRWGTYFCPIGKLLLINCVLLCAAFTSISDTTSWFHPPPGKIFSVVGSLQIWLSKIHLPYLNLARNGSTFCLKTQSICFPTNYRLHGIQRSGLWGHIPCQHCHRRWLCWLHIWLPGQFQLLCGHVEADGTDILAGKPLPSSSRTRNST